MADNMIKFLRGNVASLPQTATPGAVYFTKDEGLYLGLEDGSYHRYGDFITKPDVASLPVDGAHETCMYYCVAENVLAKWDGEKWVQINKQKTLAELGGVAKSVYEAKIALLEKADTDNATAVSDLETYVGTFTHDTAKTVVEYINAKTDGIATSGNLEALGARVTTAENDIDKLEASLADGGATATAIANAKAAGDAAQSDVDALELKVGEVAEGKTVVGLIGEAQTQANKGVTDAATAQAKADEAYNLANGKATMTQVNEAIAGAGHAVQSEVDTALSNMETAYKKADSDLKTELEGKIGAKVAQTDYDTKVAALEGEDTRLAGLIAGIDTEYKKADTALDGRIAALEADITGLSGAMHFKGVVDALPETTEDYNDGDTIIVGNKEYVVNGEAFVELGDVSAEVQRISDLEGVVGNAEGGLVKDVADNAAAISAEKTRAEAKEAELAAADTTNLQAAKDYADDVVEALGIADYVKKADADAAYAVIGHNHDDKYDTKGAAAAAESAAKAYADGLAGNYATAAQGVKADTALQAADITTGNANGTIAVKGTDVAVKGLGSAAYAATTAFDAAGTAETKANAAESNAKAYADGLAGNYDASGSAAQALTDAKAYADTAESDAIATSKAYTDTALAWGSF